MIGRAGPVNQDHRHEDNTFPLIDVATFQDQAANADAAGEVQLNGANLTFFDNILIGAAKVFGWIGRARVSSPADSVVLLTNAAASDFGRLQLGGTTSSFPALKRTTTTLTARLADDSADTGVLGSFLQASAAAGVFAGTNPATAGTYNLPNSGSIFSRNSGNSADSGQVFMRDSGSIADNGTVNLTIGGITNVHGLLLVLDSQETMAAFALAGSAHLTSELFDPFAGYSVTAGTDPGINVYWSAGNSRYELENRVGSAATFQLYYWLKV